MRIPENMEGGELVLKSPKRQVGQVKPQNNTLLYFQGDLTHSVKAVKTPGNRLSLVCEQYNLSEVELGEIPVFTLESRASTAERKLKVKSQKSK